MIDKSQWLLNYNTWLNTRIDRFESVQTFYLTTATTASIGVVALLIGIYNQSETIKGYLFLKLLKFLVAFTGVMQFAFFCFAVRASSWIEFYNIQTEMIRNHCLLPPDRQQRDVDDLIRTLERTPVGTARRNYFVQCCWGCVDSPNVTRLSLLDVSAIMLTLWNAVFMSSTVWFRYTDDEGLHISGFAASSAMLVACLMCVVHFVALVLLTNQPNSPEDIRENQLAAQNNNNTAAAAAVRGLV